MNDSILKTLAYADIFDYPLTEKEIWQWLICSTPLVSFKHPLKSFKKDLSELVKNGKVTHKDNYYFLLGREQIVQVRDMREKWSSEKLNIAFQTAQKLKNLPWIKMVGITGALAMQNCKEDDDIDLIIISTEGRLWLTRLLILISSRTLGIKRRKPKESDPKDKICFNLFLDEGTLKIQEENLFTAHEICQVKPLIDKNKSYNRFLWENRWVQKYLPNATVRVEEYKSKRVKKGALSLLLYLSFTLLEKIAFRLQYLYMRPKITNEKISLHQAFFHPKELNNYINAQFEQRLADIIKKNN